LRGDVEADDVVTMLVGIFVATQGSDDRARVGRLLDLVLGGLRPGEHSRGL
jgi:hypothetical protein